jgi:hypothetical protein
MCIAYLCRSPLHIKDFPITIFHVHACNLLYRNGQQLKVNALLKNTLFNLKYLVSNLKNNSYIINNYCTKKSYYIHQ